jgi:hypothetical protein
MSNNLNADDIYKKFMKEKKNFSKFINDPEIGYLCYLIYILYFYCKRWNCKLPEDERSCRVWIGLVKKIGQKYFEMR